MPDFTLSLRDVEELLAERGIDISDETVRRWFLKFERPSARWHLDEMIIKFNVDPLLSDL